MPIPALMTTPYANAKPAARATRAPAPDQNQSALQIMRGLQANDARPSPTIASGMENAFRELRAPAADFGPGMMTSSAGTFGEQNARANVGIYEPGSFGDQNARANGTGFDPVQWMMHAGLAETATVGGGKADGAALNNGLDSWARGGAPAAKGGKAGSAVDMMYGSLPAGPAAALKVSDMRTSLAAARTQARDIDPVLTMLTPGLNPAQRNAKLSADADNQRLTGVPPEMAADRLGYLDKLAVRASGIPEAMYSGRDVFHTTDANGRPVLSERQTSEPGGRHVVDMDPLAPSAYDQNRGRAEDLATNAREMMGDSARTQATAQHGTQLGKLMLERDAAAKSGRTEDVAHYNKMIGRLQEGAAGGFPRTIDAGGRKLIEVSTGKFTDEKGAPVEWRDEKPPTFMEFVSSPNAYDKFKGDYLEFVKSHKASMKAVGDHENGTGGGPQGKPPAQVVVRHEDLLESARRRGMIK